MKPLQGNLDLVLIRASRGPFCLKHNTQGPSQIHIPKGKLLLRCLWKDGLPFQSKTGNQLSRCFLLSMILWRFLQVVACINNVLFSG